MNACGVPFIIYHSHPAFIRLSRRETRVVKEPRSNGKHRKSQRDESCINSRCVRVVSVVHQDAVLSQERWFVHHGEQEVEAGEISLNLIPIGNGQIRLHHKGLERKTSKEEHLPRRRPDHGLGTRPPQPREERGLDRRTQTQGNIICWRSGPVSEDRYRPWATPGLVARR